MRNTLYRIKQKIISSLKKPINYKAIFENGFESFKKTGITSPEAYDAFLNLYCKTNGQFFEDMHQKIISGKSFNPVNISLNGCIGNIDSKEFNTINNTLNKDGYCNFNKSISAELVTKLYNYALKTPTLTAPNYDKPTIFNPESPVSEMYRFKQNDLINNPDIQELIMDPTLINIARNYLGCEPIFDFPAMWWSTNYLKEASSEAAQLYHFDLDRLKWLKIFIYLNDVTLDNGPHRLIKGSHIPGAKPKNLLKRGYARIPDEDLTKHYKSDDFIVVIGEAGAVFAEDTKCWHKGTPLKSGHRLVLEFEYTSCLFGANYPKYEVENSSSTFKQFCENNPVYATNFIFKN
jgi:hypothetical protein